ncbi:VanZ family protein [Microbacterium sp. NPDC058345]|uniref:VanZ family protein n=1 Tax=Microbacterium sp. NPDC058345 TaxID=3346455 RepID=UPI00366849D5
MPRPLVIAARSLLGPYLVALALVVWLPAVAASRVTGLAFFVARSFSDVSGVSLSISNALFEFLANIALFVPFGLLLATAWPRINAWLIILLGCAASVSIEVVQTLLPSRYPTLSDVIANTLGMAIGCLSVRMLWRSSASAPPAEVGSERPLVGSRV